MPYCPQANVFGLHSDDHKCLSFLFQECRQSPAFISQIDLSDMWSGKAPSCLLELEYVFNSCAFSCICCLEACEENVPVSDHKNKGIFLCLMVVNQFSVLSRDNCLKKDHMFQGPSHKIRDMQEMTGKSQILISVFSLRRNIQKEQKVHCLEHVVKGFQRYS